ncbi:hypothetical protein [Bacillus pumilus]
MRQHSIGIKMKKKQKSSKKQLKKLSQKQMEKLLHTVSSHGL